jgi:hypothetical protein
LIAYFTALNLLPINSSSAEKVFETAQEAMERGDASLFDEPLRMAEGSRDGLTHLVPPAPCRQFHDAYALFLGELVDFVRAIQDAIRLRGGPAIAAVQQRTASIIDRLQRFTTELNDPSHDCRF